MKHTNLRRGNISSARVCAAVLVGASWMSGAVYADDVAAPSTSSESSPAPTKHQLMKDCMAKEKAADSGRPSYELSADCKDITKTEKQNAQAQKKATDDAAP